MLMVHELLNKAFETENENENENKSKFQLKKIKSFQLMQSKMEKQLNKKLHGPFLQMGFNCLEATEPLRRDSLFFTTQFPGIPGTHLINLKRMKG